MTVAEVLARIEMMRHALSVSLTYTMKPERDGWIDTQIKEIIELEHRMLVAQHLTEIEIAGQRKTVHEWLAWKEELYTALVRCGDPAAGVADEILALGVAVELQVQLSNATVDIDGPADKGQATVTDGQ